VGNDLRGRHFLDVSDLSQDERLGLLEAASRLKHGFDPGTPPARRSVAMIFQPAQPEP
jgi:ornithine carbamoyltransferase